MVPQLFANGIVNFDKLILFTDPIVTDVCDIPLGKEDGGGRLSVTHRRDVGIQRDPRIPCTRN